ncbi:cell surface protein [Lactobacillus paragasseri]|uniref:aggregation-promoting factor n=1 Tax=Lactobacillus paragasseri TaxID=2107999 RepID=UPI0029C1CE80|nr:cell surface protein [Lactobacillus paragasseri]MDX5081222.1 cell surface protein [Lactobacillus paragasseri]
MKFQSILTKSLAAAALTATGLVALNSQNTNDAQAATIVQNDTNVVTINNANSTVAVWDGVENAHFTGKELVHGTTWKVIRTAYDAMGNKWYDLGANQWIMAKYTVEGGNAATAKVATATTAQAPAQQAQAPAQQAQASVQKQQTTQVQQSAQKQTTSVASQQVNTQAKAATQVQHQTVAQAPKTNYNYNVQRTYSAPVQQRTYSYASAQKQTTQVAQKTQTTTSYTSNASGSEAAAKAWIAGRESGGSYSARNGQYIGKYQLSASYLGGDYSAANQERVADNYVKSRYGSWTGAQKFWQTNGWY